MTMQEMMSLTVEDIDLILSDQLDLYTEEELRDLRQWRMYLISQEEKSKVKESEENCKGNDYEVKALKCPKCEGLNDATNTHCVYCDYILREENGAKESEDENESVYTSAQLFFSIAMSIIGFVLTAILRFEVHEKVDLTPSAWNATWGMAVPSDMKPGLLAISVVFTLISTALGSKMDKREKSISNGIAIFSLVASILLVFWRMEI